MAPTFLYNLVATGQVSLKLFSREAYKSFLELYEVLLKALCQPRIDKKQKSTGKKHLSTK